LTAKALSASTTVVKRFVARLRHQEPEQFDRLSFLPGQEMQVDYGEGAPTRVPGSERYRKPRLFVATLRYSRASFRCVVWKSSQQIWAELHEQALRYFGGCPLRRGVRSVCDDSCVRMDHSSYAARPASIGSKVLVRIYAQRIEIRDLHTRALLRTHTKAERPGTVVLPMQERVFNPSRETRLILRQISQIGEHAGSTWTSVVARRLTSYVTHCVASRRAHRSRHRFVSFFLLLERVQRAAAHSR